MRFHHEGGLIESRYFELFSQLEETPPHTKSALTVAPFLLFKTFGVISANFVFEIFAAISWDKNLGRNLVKDHRKVLISLVDN